jgi:hypothetical protein
MLALLATFYQLYLQRAHNEKSLKPLGQIVLNDHNKVISIYLRNHGLGPLIIEKLLFSKQSDAIFSSIEECLDIDPRSYMHISKDDDVIERVLLPNSSLVIFEKNFSNYHDEEEMNSTYKKLSQLTLKVEGRDIYDNRIIIKRKFQWFARYTCILR